MQNKPTYHISQLQSSTELNTIIEWMRLEGWNPGLHDADCFLHADPHGFFCGRLGDEIISTASAVIYDDAFAFFGCYLVKPGYRQQGYGMQLTKARLNYVGDRNIGLDGVLSMTNNYAKLGFKAAYKSTRYTMTSHHENVTHPNIVDANIVDANDVLFADLVAYDRRYFPAARSNFLRHWIQQRGGKALVCLEDKQITGFAVIRPCFQGYKIGPLYAEDAEIAVALFLALLSHATGRDIFLDIPEPNVAAHRLVSRYGMNSVYSVLRMYTKAAPAIDLQYVYGITTFELG